MKSKKQSKFPKESAWVTEYNKNSAILDQKAEEKKFNNAIYNILIKELWNSFRERMGLEQKDCPEKFLNPF